MAVRICIRRANIGHANGYRSWTRTRVRTSELTDDGTIDVDDNGRTSVEGVFAVGDVTPDHNQIPVAMGQGAKAGLTIHKELRDFPRSADEIERDGPVTEADVPAISPELLATAISHEGHAGGPHETTRAPAIDD